MCNKICASSPLLSSSGERSAAGRCAGRAGSPVGAPRETGQPQKWGGSITPQLSGAQEGPECSCPLPWLPTSRESPHCCAHSSLVCSPWLGVANAKHQPVPVVPVCAQGSGQRGSSGISWCFLLEGAGVHCPCWMPCALPAQLPALRDHCTELRAALSALPTARAGSPPRWARLSREGRCSPEEFVAMAAQGWELAPRALPALLLRSPLTPPN